MPNDGTGILLDGLPSPNPTGGRGVGVSRLGRNVKQPYFYTQEAARVFVLARLLVSEEVFWTELGLALGIKFTGWEDDAQS